MEMTYEEFINNILETRGRFACGEEYHERHHIVPRCMGGGDEEENLIDLFAREHFEAHRLLALENPNNDKLVYAWWCMSFVKSKNTNERYEITAEEYEEIKTCYSAMCAVRYLGENNPCYGRKHTEEEKKKMNKPHLSIRGENHPMYGKHPSSKTLDLLSEKAKNRLKDKNNHPMYGKTMSEKSKNKNMMSQKTRKPVICIETNVIYFSVREAERKTGVHQAHIIECCKGKKQTAGGYHWCYADEIKQNDSKGENCYGN